MDLEDELTEAKFIGGESDSAYAERVRDWKNAIAMCNKEKHIFAQTIGKTKKTLVALSKKDTVGKALSDIDDDLASRASSYISHVDKYVASETKPCHMVSKTCPLRLSRLTMLLKSTSLPLRVRLTSRKPCSSKLDND